MNDAVKIKIKTLARQFPAATIAVAAHDGKLDRGFEILGDRVFHAASTMKIPIMYEVYRQAAGGGKQLSDSLLVTNSFRSIVDGSTFSIAIDHDSDGSLFDHIGELVTVNELVNKMITVSSNLATNILIDHYGAANVQSLIDSLGTTKMRVLRGVEDGKAFDKGWSNTCTASDLVVLLRRLAERRVVDPRSDAEMLDILLSQEFRNMIPSGLPPGISVAHKTGQITNNNHDAAILFPSGPTAVDDWIVLVILIEGISDHETSASLGSEIAKTTFEYFR